MKKLISMSFNLSLAFGAVAAILCAGVYYRAFIMVLALLCGFLGFVLCCTHIVMVQRDETIKQAPTPLLLLSLLLNSTPLICMMVIAWILRHGS